MWKKLDEANSRSGSSSNQAPEMSEESISEMLMGAIRDSNLGHEKELPQADLQEKSKTEVAGLQPQPISASTLGAYTEAVKKFTKSATAFIECLPLLSEAREAYEEATRASTELRKVLDSGDENLHALMNQLAQMANAQLVNAPMLKSISDRKKPEPSKLEAMQVIEEARAKIKRFP
jgi:hypothetical protein